MKTPSTREKEILEAVVKILKDKLKPARIILFGSRAKGRAYTSSDFDFAVDAKRPGIRIETELDEQIEHVSGLYSVDIIYLRSVEKEFRDIVLKTGKVMYEKRRK
ncbi:MAG: nucleotidyltransferase domain-containing protein [Candidatus Omnitrophica bacterium]|nr:nucleotidyltransferase domain-containing protein [Candidatus Omnitrophota bacterium]